MGLEDLNPEERVELTSLQEAVGESSLKAGFISAEVKGRVKSAMEEFGALPADEQAEKRDRLAFLKKKAGLEDESLKGRFLRKTKE